MREFLRILGTVEGIEYPASWAEPGHSSRIEIVAEVHEGQRLAFLSALTEDGHSVRIDLDREGWAELGQLAGEVVNRIDAAEAEEARP